jgi:hypothetical protein
VKNVNRCFLFVLLAAMIAPAYAQDGWMLLSRESGCIGLDLLTKMERLAKPPASPEEFAAMMRSRGHTVTIGIPEGFPPALAGKAVMVKYAENRAPIFLQAELCRMTSKP